MSHAARGMGWQPASLCACRGMGKCVDSFPTVRSRSPNTSVQKHGPHTHTHNSELTLTPPTHTRSTWPWANDRCGDTCLRCPFGAWMRMISPPGTSLFLPCPPPHPPAARPSLSTWLRVVPVLPPAAAPCVGSGGCPALLCSPAAVDSPLARPVEPHPPTYPSTSSYQQAQLRRQEGAVG